MDVVVVDVVVAMDGGLVEGDVARDESDTWEPGRPCAADTAMPPTNARRSTTAASTRPRVPIPRTGP